MGYMRHHAIVVTSWDYLRIAAAYTEAQRIGCAVAPIAGPTVNGYCSFLIAPDGSKEGWDESAAGDERRDRFVEWIRAQAFEDGSSAYSWVEVQYGDDDLQARLLRSGDEDYARHPIEPSGPIAVRARGFRARVTGEPRGTT